MPATARPHRVARAHVHHRSESGRSLRPLPRPLVAATAPLRAHPRLGRAAQALPCLAHRSARVIVDMPRLALMKVRATLDRRPLQLTARSGRVRVRQVLHDHVGDAVELSLCLVFTSRTAPCPYYGSHIRRRALTARGAVSLTRVPAVGLTWGAPRDCDGKRRGPGLKRPGQGPDLKRSPDASRER